MSRTFSKEEQLYRDCAELILNDSFPPNKYVDRYIGRRKPKRELEAFFWWFRLEQGRSLYGRSIIFPQIEPEKFFHPWSVLLAEGIASSLNRDTVFTTESILKSGDYRLCSKKGQIYCMSCSECYSEVYGPKDDKTSKGDLFLISVCETILEEKLILRTQEYISERNRSNSVFRVLWGGSSDGWIAKKLAYYMMGDLNSIINGASYMVWRDTKE